MQTLLLCDDHHVLYRAGTRRVVHPAVRHEANPVLAPTQPWELAVAGSSIHRDPATGRYQLWYQAFSDDRAQERTHRCVVCYAASEDGIHFHKPNLGLFSYNGIDDTNIVLIGRGGFSDRYANSVIVAPQDPDPQRRYKMAYYDFEDSAGVERPGVCIAFSPDGIHWTKHTSLPVLATSYGAWGEEVPFADSTDRPWSVPLSMSDGVDTMYDPVRECFALYGKMWIDGPEGRMYWKHAMGRTESQDFLEWSTPQLICAPDEQDVPEVEFHTTPVFYHRGVYGCLNQILDRGTGGGVIDIELMLSRDGIVWERPFRQDLFLRRSDGNAFDGGSIFTNSTPVLVDDEMRFYYGAYSQGATSADDRTHDSGIGLATVPRDRLAGIAAVETSAQTTLGGELQGVGQVTIRPLDLSSSTELVLNADARDGSIRVEVLDAQGRRLRGFTKQDVVPLQGDSLNHHVTWQGRTLADLPAGDILLRIHLENAVVYALSM